MEVWLLGYTFGAICSVLTRSVSSETPESERYGIASTHFHEELAELKHRNSELVLPEPHVPRFGDAFERVNKGGSGYHKVGQRDAVRADRDEQRAMQRKGGGGGVKGHFGESASIRIQRIGSCMVWVSSERSVTALWKASSSYSSGQGSAGE